MNSLYKILDVDSEASQEEIKKAFRRAAKRHHPDNGGDSVSFSEAAKAYSILSVPFLRKRYDNTGQTERPINTDNQKAGELISRIMQDIISQTSLSNVTSVNLLLEIDSSLKDSITFLRGQQRQLQDQTKKLVAFRKRLSKHSRLHPPYLLTSLDSQLKLNIQSLMNFYREVRMVRLARQLLEEYSYLFSREPFYSITYTISA